MEHSDDGSSAISHNDTNTPLDLDGLIKSSTNSNRFRWGFCKCYE